MTLSIVITSYVLFIIHTYIYIYSSVYLSSIYLIRCVPGQVGYYRAIYGMSTSENGNEYQQMLKDLDHNCQRVYKEHDLRLHLTLSGRNSLGIIVWLEMN